MTQQETNDTPDKAGPRVMLNEKQVLQIVSVSRSTLLRMEKTGQFPKGSYVSANRKLWFVDEIIDWQNAINGRGRGRRNHPV
jgi:prophage regulatory protein